MSCHILHLSGVKKPAQRFCQIRSGRVRGLHYDINKDSFDAPAGKRGVYGKISVMSDPATQVSGSHLILYDGVCALCNGLNAFVLPRDPQGKFHFAPLQSQMGHSILRRFERDPDDLNTFYIVTDYRSNSPRLLSKSQAGLFLLSQIGGIWKLTGVLKVLPRPLRDVVYDFVARHRYRVFGRYDTCPLPSAEHRNRFIGL